MPKDNLMSAFLTDEDGATALLATLLNPEIGHPIQARFWGKLADALSAAGINLPANVPPIVVRPQYMSIDLVLVWDAWLIVLENKVQAASITKNQLSRYYRVTLKTMLSDKFLNDASLHSKRIAVIYLTPTPYQGSGEFESLQLDATRDDRKLHLDWPMILEQAEECLVDADLSDPFVRVISDGCQLIKSMLAKSRSPKTPESPQRDAARRFLDVVQAKIIASMPSQEALKLHRWKNPELDQLCGWKGRHGFGNVYLNVFADGSDLSREPPALLHAHLQFWPVPRYRRACAQLFTESMLPEWARRLDLDPSKLELAEGQPGIVFEEVWKETVSSLEDKIAQLFCRFLEVFRPIMEGDFRLSPPSVE